MFTPLLTETILPYLACFLLVTSVAGPATAADEATEAKEGSEPAGIYCKLSSAELRERVGEVRADFLASIVKADELNDGYRFSFEKSAQRLSQLADFVHFESECCPFLHFEISLEGESEIVTLSLRGPEGTKEFLETMAETAEFDLDSALTEVPRSGRE